MGEGTALELQMRLLDRRELPGFAPYLLPRTRAALERGDMAVTAVGAVCGRSAYGAAAFRLDGDRAVMTDLFVDAAVRRLRERQAAVRARTAGSYRPALRILRGNPSAAANHQYGDAMESLRRIAEARRDD